MTAGTLFRRLLRERLPAHKASETTVYIALRGGEIMVDVSDACPLIYWWDVNLDAWRVGKTVRNEDEIVSFLLAEQKRMPR